MKIADWDIDAGRRYIQPYFGSHRLCFDEDGKDCWGRDFYFQFLGLLVYIAIEWR